MQHHTVGACSDLGIHCRLNNVDRELDLTIPMRGRFFSVFAVSILGANCRVLFSES